MYLPSFADNTKIHCLTSSVTTSVNNGIATKSATREVGLPPGSNVIVKPSCHNEVTFHHHAYGELPTEPLKINIATKSSFPTNSGGLINLIFANK